MARCFLAIKFRTMLDVDEARDEWMTKTVSQH